MMASGQWRGVCEPELGLGGPARTRRGRGATPAASEAHQDNLVVVVRRDTAFESVSNLPGKGVQ